MMFVSTMNTLLHLMNLASSEHFASLRKMEIVAITTLSSQLYKEGITMHGGNNVAFNIAVESFT